MAVLVVCRLRSQLGGGPLARLPFTPLYGRDPRTPIASGLFGHSSLLREGIPYVRGLLFEGSHDRAGRLIILSGYGWIPLLRENSRLAVMVASRFMQVSEEVYMMR